MWSRAVICLLAKECLTVSAMCVRARCSGGAAMTCFSTEPAWCEVRSYGDHTNPFRSINAISMNLLYDLDMRTFWGLGEAGVFFISLLDKFEALGWTLSLLNQK